MGLQINGNNGLFAQRQVGQTSRRLTRTIEQLASGLRINRAAQDAAGLAIAEGFRASVRQLNQEVNSLQSGVNLTQTAEGGLSAQSDAIGRLQELATQAANGTLTDDQRAAINAEAQQLLDQINDTAENTEFNGVQVLNGGANNLALDPNGENTVTIAQSNTNTLGINGLDLSTQAGAQAALGSLQNAQETLNANRAEIGAHQNRLEVSINARENAAENLQEAESRIRDLDLARATVQRFRDQVLLQGGIASLVQGNLQNRTALRLLGG